MVGLGLCLDSGSRLPLVLQLAAIMAATGSFLNGMAYSGARGGRQSQQAKAEHWNTCALDSEHVRMLPERYNLSRPPLTPSVA